MSIDEFNQANDAFLEEKRGTSLVLNEPARVVFNLTNFSLKTPISCEQFDLSPLQPRSGSDDAAPSSAETLRRTAMGTYTLPEDEPRDWPTAGQSFYKRVDALRLLLSFTQRRLVAIYGCTLETGHGSVWRRQGVHIPDRILANETEGRPWISNDYQLQTFLTTAYPQLLDEDIAEKQGVRLALALLDQSFGQRVGESEYLLAWMAIEILVRRSSSGPQGESAGLLDAQHFVTVKRELLAKSKEVIERLVADGSLDPATANVAKLAYGAKIGRLNSPGIVPWVVAFANGLLGPGTEPTIVREQIEPLVELRNEIVHTGAIDEQSYRDYSTTMRYRTHQVTDLAQRLILALLNIHPFNLGGTWQSTYERFEQYLAESLSWGYEPPVPIKDFRKVGRVPWQPPADHD